MEVTEAPETGSPPPAEAAEARRALLPWVARPSRVQIVALALVTCLALGPLVATAVVVQADVSPLRVVVEAPPHGDDVTQVTVTALAVSPTAGELRVRLALQPQADLLAAGGRLNQQVTVAVNDARGSTSHTLEAGQPVSAFEVVLPLNDGSVTRYPFDEYESPLIVVVTTGDPDDEPTSLPIVVEARSTVGDFVAAIPDPPDADEPQRLLALDWELHRPATTTVYAVWLMVVMWALAAIGLLIVWVVLIWRVELPPWVFGYFVGVLFALPPLRSSLPGAPPPGTLFDFISFYWAVAIVATSLILALVMWVRRERAQAQLRALDDSRPEDE